MFASRPRLSMEARSLWKKNSRLPCTRTMEALPTFPCQPFPETPSRPCRLRTSRRVPAGRFRLPTQPRLLQLLHPFLQFRRSSILKVELPAQDRPLTFLSPCPRVPLIPSCTTTRPVVAASPFKSTPRRNTTSRPVPAARRSIRPMERRPLPVIA